MYVTTEGQGMVDLRIVIFDPPAGGTPRRFILLVSTMDGTASMCMAFIQLSAIIQFFSVANDDYMAVSNQLIQFNIGDTMQTHTIIINDDMMCENNPNEFFFSNILLDSGVQPIFVIRPQATVTINDEAEPECRKSCSA